MRNNKSSSMGETIYLLGMLREASRMRHCQTWILAKGKLALTLSVSLSPSPPMWPWEQQH